MFAREGVSEYKGRVLSSLCVERYQLPEYLLHGMGRLNSVRPLSPPSCHETVCSWFRGSTETRAQRNKLCTYGMPPGSHRYRA